MATYTRRYEKLREYMRECSLDAIVITATENYLYFSGYNNPDGFMIVTANESVVFADFRYFEAAKEKCFPVCTVKEQKGGSLDEWLKTSGASRIGFENSDISVARFDKMKKTTDEHKIELCPVDETITEIRSIKEREEVDLIVKAQRIAEKALGELLTVIKCDMTELEVAAELEYRMKKLGSTTPSFETIAVSGKASSVPHGVPRPVKLERGFLTIDFGAMVGGYHSDMTRTFCVGKADAEQKRLYDTVLAAQTAAHGAIGPGVTGDEADAVARKIIDSAGYEGRFGHSLGHGVGLLIHELPNLSPKIVGRKLVPGNVVTNEPGIYIEGLYGCRIEDMVFITEDGAENLTEFTKELIEI